MLQPEGFALTTRPILLLTRPEPQSRRFAKALDDLWPGSVNTIISPLSRLAFRDSPPDLQGVGTLVFTSETGVQAFCRLSDRRDLPVWAVGPSTTKAAEHAGLLVRTGPGDAAGLVQKLLENGPHGTVLHVRGRDIAFPVAEALAQAGISARDAILYDQLPVPATAEALAALSGTSPVIAPLFSPKAAESFANLAKGATAPLYLAAMSDAVARCVSTLRPVRLVVADAPDGGSMLAAVSGLVRDL